MSGKFAFAAFVAALFALPRFTVVQAQAHLQPRDTLPTQNNSTQDHILPCDDLTSTFANTSDTTGEKSKRTLVARNVEPLKIQLEKLSARSQYTGKILVNLGNSQWKDFNVVFSTVAQDNMWLVSDGVRAESKFYFENTFPHTYLRSDPAGIDVIAFGGSGMGGLYRTMITVDHLTLGNVLVGGLAYIQGFGGEVGDGVVPLARLARSNSRSETVRQQLVELRAYPERVMAIALRLFNGGASELHIGAIDQTAYDGHIQYHQCDEKSPFWMIKGASIHVGEEEVAMKKIIFDTTSQFIRGPESKVQRIYKSFDSKDNFEFDKELGLYTNSDCNIPEDKLPKISIHVGTSQWWTIEPKLFQQTMPTHPGRCFGLFAPHTAITPFQKRFPPRPSNWLIPVPVDHYTIFDWGPSEHSDKSSVGIAKLKPRIRPE